MNTANSVNITVNLIYQGKEVTVPTLKLRTLSQETIDLIGIQTAEEPIALNSFTDWIHEQMGIQTVEEPIALNSFTNRIKELKDNLNTENHIPKGLSILFTLSIGVITALALCILSPPVGISFGCGITALLLMSTFSPGLQKGLELDTSEDLGKVADFFIENDRIEKSLEKQCHAESSNTDLQDALNEFRKVKAFYSKFTKMRVPCISSESAKVLKEKCDFLELQLDHSGFDLSSSENSALENLSESILDLKVAIKHHKFYKIIHLIPLTLFVAAVALGIFVSLTPFTCALGLTTLYIALRGFMLRDIREQEVNVQRLNVERTTEKFKTFFTQDFDALKDELRLAIEEDDVEERPSLKKALKELERAITYFTEMPDQEREPGRENCYTFLSNLLDYMIAWHEKYIIKGTRLFD
ncbi:MAG: hypothetical protein H0T62_06940 [Parachlamydiaceae bacterium]|nr:hypothetical protein [Parachlamydiaceae bacterium]